MLLLIKPFKFFFLRQGSKVPVCPWSAGLQLMIWSKRFKPECKALLSADSSTRAGDSPVLKTQAEYDDTSGSKIGCHKRHQFPEVFQTTGGE